MAIERTLSIIKPDAVAKNVIGKIYWRFETNGLKVIAAKSLLFAVSQRGLEFEYALMTRGELEALRQLDPASAGARARDALAEKLLPLPVALFAAISVVYTGLTVAATYFEAGLIGRVLAAMPLAVQKIQIATRERQQLEEENMRMGMELDVAQRLQAMILPRGEELRGHKDLEIAAHMVSASEIGGDIYDVLDGPGDSTLLVIGDVTDHGLASGVVMPMTQAALRTALEATDGDLVGSLVRVNSVVYKNVVSGVWFLRGLHHHGSSAMVVVVILHMLQVVWAGAYRAPREVNWWTGLAMGGLVLAFALTGYLLPWDQKGYWATQVATGIMGSVPGGEPMQQALQGGPQYGNLTITRFYALHVFVLPISLTALLVGHVALFRKHGVTPPAGLSEAECKRKAQPFWPDQLFLDVLAMAVCGAALVALKYQTHGAELFAPADPASNFVARPEWYFLFLYQLLKYFEGPLQIIATVLLPGGWR